MFPRILAAATTLVMVSAAAQPHVSGELKRWHRVSVTFDGPQTSEGATPNPFLDYRLNVTFTHPETRKTYVVPGFFAADGNAAESSASSGNKWRVHFTPDEEGEWTYLASFRAGAGVALEAAVDAGKPVSFDGAKGSFQIGPSDAPAADFRGKGSSATPADIIFGSRRPVSTT